MSKCTYELRYLPLFYQDLKNVLMYISNELCNVKAADDLLAEVEKAILDRQNYAESFEPYYSIQEREWPYYRIYIKNYVIYYVVIDEGFRKIMEVRRFLNSRQNRSEII